MQRLLGGAFAIAALAAVPCAQAQTTTGLKEKTFHAFTGGKDGGSPNADLVQDASGNIYGTTQAGGSAGYGTVFKLSKAGGLKVLHTFAGAPDGADPIGGLTVDSAGNFYGSTTRGGASDVGVLFKITPDGTLTNVYSFTGAKDGSAPIETMAIDTAGNLYGIAGGIGTFGGVAFKYDTVSGKFTTLHTFTGGTNDGGLPLSSLLLVGDELYGNSYYGGASGAGTVFKLSTTGKFALMHSFSKTDGGYPNHSRMAFDSLGNLFGVTKDGGANGSNSGVLFEIAADETYTVVHTFGSSSTDGQYPFGGIYIGHLNNVFGTTAEGGANNAGVVFEFTPKAVETTFSFPGAAGSFPQGDLSKIGNFLYGSTVYGGTSMFGGTVFRFSP